MFINNTATEGSGGILYGVNRETTALILESTFIDNTARTCGIENLLTIAESYHNNLSVASVFENNRAIDNSTELGGGISCVKGGSISVTCSAFNENTAARHAGVFYVDDATVSIIASSFSGNHAGKNGGVMYAKQKISFDLVKHFQSQLSECRWRMYVHDAVQYPS